MPCGDTNSHQTSSEQQLLNLSKVNAAWQSIFGFWSSVKMWFLHTFLPCWQSFAASIFLDAYQPLAQASASAASLAGHPARICGSAYQLQRRHATAALDLIFSATCIYTHPPLDNQPETTCPRVCTLYVTRVHRRRRRRKPIRRRRK